MILSLDSSVVIDLMRGREAGVRERFLSAEATGARFKLSSVALYELATGARKSTQPDAKLEELDKFLEDVDVEPFDGEDALLAGSLRAEFETPGATLHTADLLIGAQALNRGWPVVTSNVRHFGRFDDLRLFDWRITGEPLDRPYIIARRLGRNKET